MENLLTLDELSEKLRISRHTIYYYIRSEGLPTIRIGKHVRFNPRNVERWIFERQARIQA